jgi:hypothetical protein
MEIVEIKIVAGLLANALLASRTNMNTPQAVAIYIDCLKELVKRQADVERAANGP